MTTTDTGRQGRPRPKDVIDRDNAVLSLVQLGPKTSSEIADELKVARGTAYLSLYRLRRDGKVKVSRADGGRQIWTVAA